MNSLLIRAEDKNVWERRAPLVPGDIKEIIRKTGAGVFVERSDKRYFTEAAYRDAGAGICDGMAPGDVIVGVKEIPAEKILPAKTYLFFSHTIKGQKSGMPLLRRIMDSGATLIDYEKITDEYGTRSVYFGRYAGDVGAIDILSLMGEYWAYHGIATPFTLVKTAPHYDSVAHAQEHIRSVGDVIRKKGFPESLGPVVIGIMGYGNVSRGAQQIFDCLPVERIAPESLEAFVQEGRGNRNTVYLTIFREEHLVEHRYDDGFLLDEYYNYPDHYRSAFARYLPHLDILVNAVYWDARFPRFVTWEDLKRLAESGNKRKLCGIADISCDVGGAIQCTVKATDTGNPAYLCDPETGFIKDGHQGDGILVLAVDNLPAELPMDSSTFFSNQFKPLVKNLLEADFEASFEHSGLCPELKRATIVYRGELTPDYRYLAEHLGDPA